MNNATFIAGPDARLASVSLDGETPMRLSPILEADRAQAVADLQIESRFALLPAAGSEAHSPDASVHAGPYALHLSIHMGKLVFDVCRLDHTTLHVFFLALGPFRRLIKDYRILVDSYGAAIEQGRDSHIQAIDMGRRGLHNEGAQLMMDRLAGKVAIDFATARRLFTLVCVLHQRV